MHIHGKTAGVELGDERPLGSLFAAFFNLDRRWRACLSSLLVPLRQCMDFSGSQSKAINSTGRHSGAPLLILFRNSASKPPALVRLLSGACNVSTGHLRQFPIVHPDGPSCGTPGIRI
jgi:hypothetical protein